MKVEYFGRFFKDIKSLRKKYREIDHDILRLTNSLERGEVLGSIKLHGINGFDIYKIRLKNSSKNSGKSGGFRVIYYSQIDEKTFYLITIYCKSQKSDISKKEILEIFKTEKFS
jgi:mRNA-degrading endonuclease RelE of RelBE toxin-antitoxin system